MIFLFPWYFVFMELWSNFMTHKGTPLVLNHVLQAFLAHNESTVHNWWWNCSTYFIFWSSMLPLKNPVAIHFRFSTNYKPYPNPLLCTFSIDTVCLCLQHSVIQKENINNSLIVMSLNDIQSYSPLEILIQYFSTQHLCLFHDNTILTFVCTVLLTIFPCFGLFLCYITVVLLEAHSENVSDFFV